jgi:hypothetical protein
VHEFDASGTEVAQFPGLHGAGSPFGGIADNGATGDFYLSTSNGGMVFHAGPLVTLPDVATEPASGVQPTAATLNGTVNPDGIQVTVCRFEYGIGVNYGQSVPCTPEPGSGSSGVPVSASLTGLLADSTYHFRVIAQNGNGILNYGADETFTTTGPPTVDEESSTNLGQTSATLRAQVDPHGFDTTYRFEYGATSAYGTSIPIPDGDIGAGIGAIEVTAELSGLQVGTLYHYRVVAANSQGTVNGTDQSFTTVPAAQIDSVTITDVTAAGAALHAQINPLGTDTTYRFEYGTDTSYGAGSVPVPDADIGSGSGDVSVTRHVSGLQANITYHVRVVASNALGTVGSGNHTFVYDTTGAGLPDNRAYEMVTPPQKNAAAIGNMAFGLAPAVAEDGTRLVLTSLQCFAGAGSCTANRGTEGEPFAFTRASGGWVTVPWAPSASRFERNSELGVNANTGTALFSIATPPFGEDDFYARRPDGSFVDVGPASPPSAGALLAVIHARAVEGSRLSGLQGPLMGMIVLPYLGPAAADRELARPTPKRPKRPGPRAGDALEGLDMRLTYRTLRVLSVLAQRPGASNRLVAEQAGVTDQGQVSKLLMRLSNLGLIENSGDGHTKGAPNAWRLSPRGQDVESAIRIDTGVAG